MTNQEKLELVMLLRRIIIANNIGSYNRNVDEECEYICKEIEVDPHLLYRKYDDFVRIYNAAVNNEYYDLW